MDQPAGDADNRGNYTCVRAESIGEIFETSVQFCCEPKSGLKNKVCFLKEEEKPHASYRRNWASHTCKFRMNKASILQVR